MLRVGIIGAQNSHCTAIARLCNVEKRFPCRVTAVWGERAEFAEAAAKAGRIPAIVRDWHDMLGHVDGVMIDHRHPKYHAEPASFFLENNVPCFVDKPFTYTLAEAKRLCALARKRKVAVTSYSDITMHKGFAKFRKAFMKLGPVANLTSTGPVDLKSEYGGVFFYGIHQVDAIIELLGTNVQWASLQPHGEGGVAVLAYRGGPIVTMNCVNNGNRTFHWSVVGGKEVLDWTHCDDPNPYLASTRTFMKMFRTGQEPFSHERLLAPVAVLEAMAKSMKLRRPVSCSL
jgi:predicted dehydrogenase